MRPATVAAAVVVLVGLGGVALVAFGSVGTTGGDLVELWVSDTPRENRANHHAAGASADGDVVVAPVLAVHGTDDVDDVACSLVRLDPADGGVVWRASLPAANCSTHAITAPEVADLDDDGDREVAVATGEAVLAIYDGESGDESARVSLSTLGYGRPTAGEVGDDAVATIVASDIRGTVVAASADGKVRWREDLEDTVWASPVVADVDADGATEVLVGGSTTVTVLDADGDRTWRRDVRARAMADGQGDDDEAREVYAASTERVVALDGADGTTEWSRPFDSSPRVHAVGDVDDDGAPEVLASLASHDVLALDAATGTTEWTTDLGDETGAMAPPGLADVTGDGVPEVVATTNGGVVAVLDGATGAELAAYERDVPIWTTPVATALDDDDGDELLVTYGDGRVAALDYAS